MALKRETSLAVGLATGALVWGVYNNALPSIAEMRVSPAHDAHADVTERTATATSVAIVAGISLIAKDPTVFILGGAMTLVLAWWYRHANAVNPMSAAGAMTPSSRQVSAELAAAGYAPGN